LNSASLPPIGVLCHAARPVGHHIGSPVAAFHPSRARASRTCVYDCRPISTNAFQVQDSQLTFAPICPPVQFPVPSAWVRWALLDMHTLSPAPSMLLTYCWAIVDLGPLTWHLASWAVRYENCHFSGKTHTPTFCALKHPGVLCSYPENLETIFVAVPEL